MNLIFNTLLKVLVRFTLTLYFRQWIVKGVNNIPRNRPVIFATNHQNAFLDALVVVCSCDRLPYYLARAGVFSGNLANSLLKLVRVMPIYRIRDGLGNVKKNDQIIEACTSLLSQNKSLVMFPEGNHGDQWRIRPLQRGLARIALQAETSKNWKLGLTIIPVGLQYEEPKSFRSRLLVTFGEPIDVSMYRDHFESNPRNGLDSLKEEVEDVLKTLVVHIPDDEYSQTFRKLQETRPFLKDYDKQVVVDRKIIDGIINNEEIPVPDNDPQRNRNPLSYLLAFWVLINNLIPYHITRAFIRSRVKDPVFISSIKLASGLAFAPIYHLAVGFSISMITGIWWYGLVYACSQPIAGYFGGFDILKKIL